MKSAPIKAQLGAEKNYRTPGQPKKKQHCKRVMGMFIISEKVPGF